MTKLSLPLCLSVLLFASSLNAQTPDTATVEGQITDPTHAGVPDANVTVTNTLSGLERSATTDSSGKYSIGGLPIAGSYNITATKTGFAEANLNNIVLVGSSTAELNL